MQYTDVFGFKKPEYAEEADVVDLNDNMDDIDTELYKLRRIDGEVYDANTTSSNPYVEGNYTINPTDGLMYKCNDTTYGAWDSTKWTRTDEFSEIELAMQSGGGGGGSAYTETTLWSGNETPPASGSDINLSGNISDYDMIAIHVGNSSYTGDNIFLVSSLTIGETYISTIYHGGNLGAFFTYTSDTQINVKAQATSYPQTYTKVVGISFGSGGGSSSGGTHYSTTEQVIGTWIDGSDVYERVYDYSSNPQSIGTSYTDFSDIDTTNISKMIYACAIHQDGTVYPSIDADPTRSSHTILGLKSFDSHTNIAYVILRYTKQV